MGIILEGLKLCFFTLTVQVLGWHIIKSNREIQKAIIRILISLKRRSKRNSIALKNQDVKIIGHVLQIIIYVLCGWLALQFTGHLIASSVERSLRMLGYTHLFLTKCEYMDTHKYDTQDIRRAAQEAEYHYQGGTYGCDIEWMTSVQMKLNAALRSRGESPV